MTTAPTITVREASHEPQWTFDVTVTDHDGSATTHRVTMTKKEYDDLTNTAVTPHETIETAFRFLLDHEQKESILKTFSLSTISRYFPEFPVQFHAYLNHRS